MMSGAEMFRNIPTLSFVFNLYIFTEREREGGKKRERE